ncbi:MAG: alpha/beta fold hydrolase, partial [Candidatus Hydrogenedentes bacterium]|nr:alpha/beta fold hydrolase [Candidatus Hydrogenedentota bacterium]
EPALLLTFAMDRATSLTKHPYCFAAEYFLAQGHRAASFDLPNHGDRVNAHGQQIEGMRNAFAAGDDPFAAFVADGRAVIDACIARGIAKPGRIAVAGTSRGGYMALRLLSGDERIAAAAAFAPVTDWRELREFAADRENADVANLQLVHFVPGMIGKQVFIAIGKTDTRVSTQHCQEFADALIAANAKAARAPALVEFHLTDDPGHSCADEWYERGRAALLQATLSGPPAP